MPLSRALEYLESAARTDVPAVCAVFGDEPFLKSQSLGQLRARVLGDEHGDFSLARFDGVKAQLREVLDELRMADLFGAGRKLVIVDDADEFVTANRAGLETYAQRPAPTGVLVLVVQTWPANTRLAKAVSANGLAIECKAPPPASVAKWLVEWARSRYGASLQRDAAGLMLEIIGPELGLLHQELAKLSAAAGKSPITSELVRQLAGGWRVKTTWDMLDAAAAGRASDALVQLDRLLTAGENPVAILGPAGYVLRHFAAAVRVIETAEAAGRRTNLRQALAEAGVKPVPMFMDKAESQLRQIGRQRASHLYQWLLEADLALKGVSSAPARARLVLEQLIVRLSPAMAS